MAEERYQGLDFRIHVRAPVDETPERIGEILNQLLNAGLGDAAASLDADLGPELLAAADLAAHCHWSSPEQLFEPQLALKLGPRDRVLGQAALRDVDNGEQPRLQVLAVEEGEGSGDALFERRPRLSLHVSGYGLKTMETGFCGVVYLEYCEGVARLIVFSDVNQEDPTHIISLEKARESNREEDE